MIVVHVVMQTVLLFHKKQLHTYSRMSYDRSVKCALDRNRVFFDKLGLPAN
jgi:hypothetical protein